LALSFTDPFLNRAARAFERRRKAIAYQGELQIEAEGEQLMVALSSFTHPVLRLVVSERSSVSLYLKSNRPRIRGKLLLRLEGLRPIGDPARLVEAFEWTIHASRQHEGEGGLSPDASRMIAQRWQELVIRLVK
jgi:hypothetical protein